MSELDLLRGIGEQVVPPSFELLKDTARRRARRDRISAAVGTLAAAGVVGALAAGLLTDAGGKAPPDPVEPPEEVSSTRPLLYALGTTVHYGAKILDAPAEVVELDVTDTGAVVRTGDGAIWFTDGQELLRIGTLGEPGSAYGESGSSSAVLDHPWGTSGGFIVTDNTGVRAAWLEFPKHGEPELVTYDTERAEEVHRLPLDVEPGAYALLASVSDRYGYWYPSPETIEDEPFPSRRIDLDSGATETITADEYATDLPDPDTPRTMMINHSQGGRPTEYWVAEATARQFDVRSGRVVPMGAQPLQGRDGGTGRPFEFAAPEGYPNTGPGWLTQWLDDDTVIIVQHRAGADDLLECRHSTGACTVAKRLPEAAVLPEVG